ncbi:hydantoinase/oxoprolinase family protein [Thermoanaerobacter kivui]|uniref:hydantoinase/oxoprolinase family protein n=1 Tax=Thermoanaerobacter kivui TaxID=2325 RepID=UPI001F1E4941|nr:hydantoinase/oxoprolinase family protein [Thermoanaerobacter kivui]
MGLDMGGTHVDAVIIDRGNIIDAVKTPTDHTNLFGSIWETLNHLLKGKDISSISHINLSTTISTNAIVEGKTAPVGMIIESGPGMEPSFLACGSENIFITGYVDHRGREIKSFKPEEIQEAVIKFKEKNIEACAVVAKFSVRNPIHEIKICKFLEDKFSPVTMGHTLSGRLNFPRRVYTSYLNSAVYHVFRTFCESIKETMKKENINVPVNVLKADGGTISLEAAQKYPVNTILSGPAASLMGALAFNPGNKDGVLLDIGGTTTDISFVADGVPLFEPFGIKIANYNTLVRAIYSVSIGLGGDSAIHVENGEIKIGPHREGPPMAIGGLVPTPSDAMIVLGLLDFGDKERAISAMKDLGEKLQLDAKATAKLIYKKMGDIIKQEVNDILVEINSRPVYTVKELLYGKKLKPKYISIIGGPAKALAPLLEKEFNLPCYVPENYEIANAIGAALAKPTAEVTVLADTAEGKLSVPEMGIYEKIGRDFTIEKAEQKALEILKEMASVVGASDKKVEGEITEKSSFNMVRGFYTCGKNIRVRAQIKPGLLYEMRGVNHVEG